MLLKLKLYLRQFAALRGIVSYAHMVLHRFIMRITDILVPTLYTVLNTLSIKSATASKMRAELQMRKLKQAIVGGREAYTQSSIAAQSLIQFAEEAVILDPQYKKGMRMLYSGHFAVGQLDDAEQWMQRIFRARCDEAQMRGLDKLNISIVNAEGLKATIGASAVFHTFLKAALLGRSNFQKFILLLDEGDYRGFVNPHIMEYFSEFFVVIRDPETISTLKPLAQYVASSDAEYMEVDGRGVLPQGALPILQTVWEKEKRPPLMTLRADDIEFGRRELEKLGMPRETWFVVIHVREGGARFDEPFRQADIKDYIPAIKAITDHGGWVVRLGDKSMTPLSKMEGVIDYPHTDAKSARMDIFLCGACRFFIGTSSGMWTIASMFGRPIAQTNYLPTWALPPSSQDMFLPKLLKYRKTNTIMSFQDLFSSPAYAGGSDFFYYHILDVDIIDNTPEELEALITEMIDQLDGVANYSQDDIELQDKFKSMSADVGAIPGYPGVPLNARIGQYFLNKHRQLLNEKNSSTTAA